jgi:hypothetical protein
VQPILEGTSDAVMRHGRSKGGSETPPKRSIGR